jgi:hypothetical protein
MKDKSEVEFRTEAQLKTNLQPVYIAISDDVARSSDCSKSANNTRCNLNRRKEEQR